MDLLEATNQTPAQTNSAKTAICGVFQGGGAKGAAYSGALAAVEDAGLRFARVAGASAGALTAATIAAGCTADDIKAEVPKGLQALAETLDGPGWRKGIRWGKSLRTTGAVFDTDKLELWIRDLFERQVGSDAPTFADLHAATGIELNVVAANVSQQNQIVFNYILTPQIDVARAVLASCSIPGAFPPGHLITAIPDPGETAVPVQTFIEQNINEFPKVRSSDHDGLRRDTIVDGGVWANYPLFVFKDTSFRTWAGLDPIAEPVVGFALDSSSPATDGGPADKSPGQAKSELGTNAGLAPWNVAIRVKRREVGQHQVRQIPLWLSLPVLAIYAIFIGACFVDGLRWVGAIGLVVGLPIVKAYIAPDRTTELDTPPWQPSPLRNLAYDLLQALHDGRLGKILLAVQLVSGLAPVVWLLFVVPTRTTGFGFAFFVLIICLVGAAVVGSTLLSLAVTALIHFSAPVLMSSGVGLPCTLLAASTDVPPWAGVADDDHVLRVPVTLATLQFDLTDEQIDRAHCTAKSAVDNQLDRLGPKLHRSPSLAT